LNELKEYTKDHFADEEEYIEAIHLMLKQEDLLLVEALLGLDLVEDILEEEVQ